VKTLIRQGTTVALATLALGLPGAHAALKTFVYCSEGSPSNFNPQIATDGTSFNAGSRQLFNRLVEFKPGTTTVVPALAEKWDIAKDQLTYTFRLRKGVKFHSTASFKPTRDLNADDVLFSFNRQRLAEHPFHKVGGGTYDYFDSMELGKIIKDIVKVDEQTVKFILTRPEAPFLADLAMDFASILSAEYADAMAKAGTPDKVDTEPVGTGPFVLVRYAKDNEIRYRAHAGYWAGKPKIDQLVFAITPDPSVRFQKLKVGECQLATEPAPADLRAMAKDPSLNVLDQAGLNVAYLAFNTRRAPFDNVLVRKAVNHALNRAAYIDAIYLGNAQVAKNPLPPTIWSYNEGVKDYDYDPAKARELLAKAGLADGFETILWTMPVSRPYNPNGKKMGELMQADLAKVGIRVKLMTYDWPTYLEKSKPANPEYGMVQFGWTGDNGDPDNFLNVLLSCAADRAGSNTAKWCYKPFDELVEKARSLPSPAARAKLYKQAQVIFKEQAPWVTIAYSKVYRALNKRVEGYRIDPLGGELFSGVDLR
jgi:dipeptide transport system substrate-binding protein